MNQKIDRTHIGALQRAVIEDMLSGISESNALEKNKISPSRYKRWLASGLFERELAGRAEAAIRQTKYITAAARAKAFLRLAELVNSEKDEIARKACLDIIEIHNADIERQEKEQKELERLQRCMPLNLRQQQSPSPYFEPNDESDIPEETAAVSYEERKLNDRLTMSYGDWIAKYGLPQSNIELLRKDQDIECADDAQCRPSPPSDPPKKQTNPDREQAIKNSREADLLLQRATLVRQLLARPSRTLKNESEKQKNNFSIVNY